jgi:branched-chain amino acid transport system permease protein
MMALSEKAAAALDRFAHRHRLRAAEALAWLATVAAYFLFPDYLALGAQVLATILFALSLDLVMGYAGIVTLGHAAFFGTGAYTAGILAAHGWGEPISGLLAAALAAALVGLASGAVILRTSGLTLLMQTLVVAAMLAELANKAARITGGADGLQGMEVWPIFGQFRFDLFGRTAYIYCGIVLLISWILVRTIVHSSLGRSLTGIRENVLRMHAVGAPVTRRRLIAYTVAAALAGVSGALIAQTAQFVGLGVLGLERSGTILIMLIIGGVGRLYGAFIGVPLYMIAQDRFSEIDPVYWYFWIGEFMVLLVVFAPGGVLGLPARLRHLAAAVFTPEGVRLGPVLRGAAGTAVLAAANLWIALDAQGGTLADRLSCLVWTTSTCNGSTGWLIPSMLWLGIGGLAAIPIARRCAPRKFIEQAIEKA